MTCDRCGAELEIGSFPFCHGNQADHARGVSAVNGDACDITQVNGAKHPIHFTSKAARRAWMKANHLVEAVRHVSLPGTDKSKHTTDWGSSYDPYTAENARILIERAFLDAKPDVPDTPLHLNYSVKTLTTQEARAQRKLYQKRQQRNDNARQASRRVKTHEELVTFLKEIDQ